MVLPPDGLKSRYGVEPAVTLTQMRWPTPRVVMPLGDSITEGFGSTDGGGYRVQLFRSMLDVGRPVNFVGGGLPALGPPTVEGVAFPTAHEGHIGFRISDLAGIVNAALALYLPNVILLHIGTNDIPHPEDIAGAPARLASLLDQIHAAAPTARVVLAKIVPSTDNFVNGIISPYNAAMNAIQAARSAWCSLCDMFSAFKSNPNYAADYMFDSTHPSTRGYNVMGDVWFGTPLPPMSP